MRSAFLSFNFFHTSPQPGSSGYNVSHEPANGPHKAEDVGWQLQSFSLSGQHCGHCKASHAGVVFCMAVGWMHFRSCSRWWSLAVLIMLLEQFPSHGKGLVVIVKLQRYAIAKGLLEPHERLLHLTIPPNFHHGCVCATIFRCLLCNNFIRGVANSGCCGPYRG